MASLNINVSVAQLVEHPYGGSQVRGSSDLKKEIHVSVAQLVEQMTLNHRVPGSSPGGDTLKRVGRCPALFFCLGSKRVRRLMG